MSSRRASAWRRAALFRALLFFVLWLMIAGYNTMDLPVGIVTAGMAAAASLRLMPPTGLRLRPAATLRFAANFVAQAVRSGIQVALLALRPSLALRPGLARYRTDLPADGRRYAFSAFASLLPGTLPTGFDESGLMLLHGLDVERPIAAELAAEEALFSRMLANE
ncbi:Na+/H+ antiporter subunit E [Reyranella sp.]|uniref:Na+/H+ antiporter subunit E n=1 Tax=Reyranella sp. TaxID=1929291 RepID=UPI003783CBFA